MRNVKCAECTNFKNEWCEKKIDSPHPFIERDCEYFRQASYYDLIRMSSLEQMAEILQTVSGGSWKKKEIIDFLKTPFKYRGED